MPRTFEGLRLVGDVRDGVATIEVHPYIIKYSALALTEKLKGILEAHPELTKIHINIAG
jgi:hypothetical protein